MEQGDEGEGVAIRKLCGKISSCCSTPAWVRSMQGILNPPGVGKAKVRWGGGGLGGGVSRSSIPPSAKVSLRSGTSTQ